MLKIPQFLSYALALAGIKNPALGTSSANTNGNNSTSTITVAQYTGFWDGLFPVNWNPWKDTKHSYNCEYDASQAKTVTVTTTAYLLAMPEGGHESVTKASHHGNPSIPEPPLFTYILPIVLSMAKPSIDTTTTTKLPVSTSSCDPYHQLSDGQCSPPSTKPAVSSSCAPPCTVPGVGCNASCNSAQAAMEGPAIGLGAMVIQDARFTTLSESHNDGCIQLDGSCSPPSAISVNVKSILSTHTSAVTPFCAAGCLGSDGICDPGCNSGQTTVEGGLGPLATQDAHSTILSEQCGVGCRLLDGSCNCSPEPLPQSVKVTQLPDITVSQHPAITLVIPAVASKSAVAHHVADEL